jgi:hypothetical protein
MFTMYQFAQAFAGVVALAWSVQIIYERIAKKSGEDR